MSDSSRLRDSDRRTRVHLTLFDRTKFLTLFVGVYLVLVWANLADNPLLNFVDSCKLVFDSKKWLTALFLIEIVRQLHFALAKIGRAHV